MIIIPLPGYGIITFVIVNYFTNSQKGGAEL
jgi:hypothetical protein